MSRSDAEKQTNMAIVQERVAPSFFDRVVGVMRSRVVPALKVIAGVASAVATIAGISCSSCSVM
jgi:hypothetical protein